MKFFATGAEFRAWLEQHAADERELLVGFHKRRTGRPSMTWQESVDEAALRALIRTVVDRVASRRSQAAARPSAALRLA